MNVIKKCHEQAQKNGITRLKNIIDKEAIFYSPVVHTPQKGREQVIRYLVAAKSVFDKADFKYTKEIIADQNAMIEFTSTIDGIYINGVDIISWNNDSQITEIKVMIRPLKAVHKSWDNMVEILAKNGGRSLV